MWVRALAIIGLVFLGAGYSAPLAAAAARNAEPASLPDLQMPQFAFPVFDKNGKSANTPDMHDAADATAPRDAGSGGAKAADEGAGSGGSGGTAGGATEQPAAPSGTD